ncbi:MAG: glycosyltransferase [Actinobacteria bacterium]|uniref:Unannotated protein n=1 Tax=freshwater metagenome TaxID=449393 RepID=A0A6J7FT03_9ZZZZ|nr:glycosyltransferase [Actinomycetota bacterium]
MRPRISVVVCTHNGATFLSDQLDSIVGQSVLPDEIVISDDASTDTTRQIIEQFVRETRVAFPGISCRVLLSEKPRGVRGNFEWAISQTTGDLIALADQDDVWHRQRLERQISLGEAPAVLLSHSNADLIDESGKSLGYLLFATLHMNGRTVRNINSGDGFRELMRRNVVTGATVMLSRKLTELAFPIPSAWLHDEWLAVVAAMNYGLVSIDEPLISYRQHASNQIGARRLNLAIMRTRVSTSRQERNARLLLRAEQLVAFVDSRGPDVASDVRAAAHRKLAHERVRWNLPAARIRRLPRIVAELVRGRYHSDGRGLQGVFLDVFQPDASDDA